MHRKKELLARLFAASLVSAALFGCSGGNDGSGSSGSTLSGVAAEGKAIAKATVSIRDASGNSRSVSTDDNGGFSFSTSGLTFPLMLKVTGSGGSYYTLLTSAEANSQRVNITSFTNAIVQLALNAADNGALDDSFGKGGFANVTPAALAAAEDAFKKLLQQEFGNVSGVTDVSPRFVAFTPASGSGDGDEIDRMLNLFKPSRAGGNGNSYISLNIVP
jgi:hypothetical protein